MRKISEIFINGICLEKILEDHEKWLNGEDSGERANLNGADLSDVDLIGANLSDIDLIGANEIVTGNKKTKKGVKIWN